MEEEGGSGVSLVTIREGEEFSLPCLAEGSPRPEVSWLKDGEPLHPYLAGMAGILLLYIAMVAGSP